MVGEIFDDVRVKSEYAELVGAHDSREKLHDEDFVVERESLVVAVQDVVELFGKSLRVMKKLKCWEVRLTGISFLFALL